MYKLKPQSISTISSPHYFSLALIFNIFLICQANLQSTERILTSRCILKKFGASDDEIKLIFSYYARKSFPCFVSADKCLNMWPMKWKRLSFGCMALDEITNNGIATQGITEISGEAGAGKSQICMQLSLMVQLPEQYGGLGRGAVYICTEDRFPSTRLWEIMNGFQHRYKHVDINYDQNIFIQHCNDSDELLNCASNQLNQLLKIKDIGLIVVDSVAGVFRTENNYIARAKMMKKFGQMLLKYSSHYNCAIVCVNQVATFIDETKLCHGKLIPCLGLAWANLINTRIQIHRTNESRMDENAPYKTTLVYREMEIISSSELPRRKAQFLIVTEGLSCNELSTKN